MPVYKDTVTGKWYCKFNYKNWLGEKKTKFKRGFAIKKEALAWEREFLMTEQVDMNMELESFVEIYFKDKKGRLKERSIISKRQMIEQKILPYFGEKRMNEITPAEILKWQNEMMSMGYKETYLRMIQNQITAVFNHAERYYGLKINPCKKIEKMGRSNARELNFWTKDEFDIFIGSFEEEERMHKLIFEVLFWTGCRCGEMLGLFYEDLDFRNNTININKTFYRRDKQDYLTSPKTESSNRKVTVPEFLMKELKAYTDALYGLKNKDRIFPITDRAIQKKLKSKSEVLGLTKIRIHDIRHSAIAFLIEKNVQPLAIAQRVGHDSVNTTMNIYGHLYPNKQKQIADMLNSEATGEPQRRVVSIGQGYGNRVAGGMW